MKTFNQQQKSVSRQLKVCRKIIHLFINGEIYLTVENYSKDFVEWKLQSGALKNQEKSYTWEFFKNESLTVGISGIKNEG